MKLVHPDFEESIEFTENKVNILCIENADYFSVILQEMLRESSGEEGPFVLSNENKILPFEKNVGIILSPFNLDINNKKFLNAVYTNMKNIAVDEEQYQRTTEFCASVVNYVQSLTDYFDHPMEIGSYVDLDMIFKSVNAKFEDTSKNILENLSEYIDLLVNVCGEKVIVLVNIKCFFGNGNLKLLYRTLINKKINLLLLENMISEHTDPCENVIIIDKDFCEIGADDQEY